VNKNKELLNYDATKEIIILWRLYILPESTYIANKNQNLLGPFYLQQVWTRINKETNATPRHPVNVYNII